MIQPWASLIIDGRKTIETRSWATKHNGPLAIHASAKIDKYAAHQFYPKECGLPLSLLKPGILKAVFPTSAILGTVMLVDCVQFPDRRAPPDAYGDFTPGRYGWLLEDVKKFDQPIPAKGHLGLWNWEPPVGAIKAWVTF